MRAQEFIVEQYAALPQEEAYPLQHTYVIPGIRNNDSYHAYRLGMAIARARADVGDATKDFPPYPEESAFAQNAIVSGFNDNVEEVIDKALKMTGTPGGKQLVGTEKSQEPGFIMTKSPVKAFRGYGK